MARPSDGAAATRSLLIDGAVVVTMDHLAGVLAPGWIRIEGPTIAGVGPGSAPEVAGVDRIDARGCIAIPGLVNAHTHLFQTLLRGAFEGRPFEDWLREIYRVGESMRDEDWRLSARLGAAESLIGGVTTLLEHQFLHGGIARSASIIEGVLETGMRLAFARTAMDIGRLAPAETLEDPTDAEAAIDELIAAYRDVIETRRLLVLGGPNTPGVSASATMAATMARHAAAADIGSSMHVAESISVVERVRTETGRVGVVDWLDGLDALPPGTVAAHAVHLADEEIAILARRRVAVAHNPVSNLFLGDGIARVPELLDAGIDVALGTDGATSNGTQDMWETMKAAVLLQRVRGSAPRWLTPREVVAMATIHGARAVGLGALIGSLEVGKRADITLLRHRHAPHAAGSHDIYSHLVYVARASDVETVLVDGSVVVADGRPVAVDAEATAQAAGRRAMELAAKLA